MIEIIEQVKDVMRRILNQSEITEDISQNNCEKWDSLRHLNLVVELETVFGIYFEPEEISKMKDLHNIIKFIYSKKTISTDKSM